MPLQAWLAEQQVAALASTRAEIDRGVPWTVIERRLPRDARSGEMTLDLITLAAAVQVERHKRRVLREVGLMRLGNPPFDQLAQTYLPAARHEADEVPDAQLDGLLDRHLGQRDVDRKRLATAPNTLQREALAWALTKERTEQALIDLTAPNVSRLELDAATDRLSRPVILESPRHTGDASVPVVDTAGDRIPVTDIFAGWRGDSPFSIEEWCALPTRPVVTPAGKPEPGPAGLAQFLFDKILYSKQVCDRNGQAVGLSPAKREEYLARVTYAIEQGLPITASEYLPLVAISNPIKRNTQSPSLTEIDMLRRLTEVARAVELYYPPGMRWLLGNEAPAFQGPQFGLPPSYVRQFHEQTHELLHLIDPDGTRLTLFDQADVLWGTPERRDEWDIYERRKLADLREAFFNPNHPEHKATRAYIATYVYPMATCISPYRFEPSRGLDVRQIAETYAALKLMTGSVVRGVGSLEKRSPIPVTLTPTQVALLDEIHEAAIDLTFQYRVTMDSREELPAFREVIPDHTIAYTMVTKRDKLVLYPNSGRGAYFPAHGEPVLVRQREEKQRTVVTVRPWWQIAAGSDRYLPMYVDGRDEPLYFEEIR